MPIMTGTDHVSLTWETVQGGLPSEVVMPVGAVSKDRFASMKAPHDGEMG